MSAQIGGTSRSVPRPRHDSALETSATLAACPKCGWLNLPAEACVHCGTTPDPPGSAPRRAVTGDALVDSAPILDVGLESAFREIALTPRSSRAAAATPTGVTEE